MSDATARRPNILWISLEDTTPRFGCYGDPLARTPNIDRLAAGGRRFPLAFSTAGVCAPSRSAIITGCYQTWLGTQHMRTTHTNRDTPELPTPYSAVVPPQVKCFSEYLRAHGYYCTNNTKTDYQFAPPVTAWDDATQSGHWRNRERPDQPFFAVFNPTLTHESGQWPKDDERLVTDPEAVELPPYLPATRPAREALARQYDNLARADEIVGRLLDELEADGLAESTIVFLWSDHGEGLPRRKRWLYDGGINIPLIVRWPGQLEPGSVSEQLVSLIDLAPTVLSLCGVEPPAHLQGQPFLGPAAADREYIHAARDRFDEAYDMVRAVRNKRYKYIRNYYPEKPYLLWIPYRNRHPILEELWRLHLAGELTQAQQALFRYPRPVEELYDCQTDPHELRNLAADPAHRATLDRLRAELDSWRAKYDVYGEVPELEMVHRWYPGGVQPTTAAPILVPIGGGYTGREAANDGGELSGPALIQLHCATQGASIAWTTDLGETPRWRLYTEPIRLEQTTTLRVRAVRIGYADSVERQATFRVT